MPLLNEGFSDLAEFRQRHRIKGNLKEDLGNEQLAINRSLSSQKRKITDCISYEKIVLSVSVYDISLSLST